MVEASRVESYQAGNVAASTLLHAVRPTINGYRAWCGAGVIEWFANDRYDATDPQSCQQCAALFGNSLPAQRPPT
jgi:hypothetical protein